MVSCLGNLFEHNHFVFPFGATSGKKKNAHFTFEYCAVYKFSFIFIGYFSEYFYVSKMVHSKWATVVHCNTLR